MPDRYSRLIKSFLFYSCTVLFFLPANEAVAQVNRQTCLNNFEEADDQIADGFFDEAIALLEVCRDLSSLDAAEQTQLFKLLADAYLAKKYVSEAREVITKILDLSPNFTPDVNLDSQLFRNLVAELRAERTTPSPPQEFNVTVEENQIRLTWLAMQDAENIDQIRILRGATDADMPAIDSVSVGASGYTDTSVMPGLRYFYALQTIGKNGIASIQSTILQASLPELPVMADEPPEPASTPKTSSRRKLVFIGGGVLLAGGIAAAVALGGSNTDPPDPTTLPGPPSIP